MSQRRAALRNVAVELGAMLQPLSDATSRPETLRHLLAHLGYEPPPELSDLGAGLAGVVDALAALRAAATAIEDAVDVLKARHDALSAERALTASGLAVALVDALAKWDPDWLLPGIHNVPAESVVILESNDAFVAAFLVSANEEVLRELSWREVAHEARSALVPCFWKPGTVDLDTEDDWLSGDLGTHVSTDETWVLVRSSLWRACPDLAMVAFPATGTGDALAPKTGGVWVLPSQEVQLSNDLVPVALPLTPDQLTGSDVEAGHYLVFTEPDFGTAFKTVDGDPESGLLAPLEANGAAEAMARTDAPDAAWVFAGRFAP